MRKNSILVLATALLAVLLLTSCNNSLREPGIYTVTFDSVGGSDVPSQEIMKGKKVVKPEAPTRDGYDFESWMTEDGTLFDFENTSITSDITLYAIWGEDNGVFVVTFDSDGGTPVEKQKVEKGEHATAPEPPTKDGYDFRGWAVGEAVYYSFDENAVSSDITLKAVWSESTSFYTVFFNSCGGSDVDSIRVKEGEKVTKPADPVYDGCKFDGWVKEDEYALFDFDNETITSDITLYADWSLITYKVTFDSKGGSDVSSQVVLPGDKVTKPADPVKSGYDFQGWLESDNTLFSFENETVNGDITLKALWKEYFGTYTVTFDSDGGSDVPMQEVKKWGKVTKPAEPNKEGFYFAYWMKSDNSVFDFENETVSSDITLKAVWSTSKYYTVKFNVDGGSYVDTQRVKEGDKVKKPVTPVKEGYVLQCWTDDLDKEYSFNTPVSSDMTLNAKWMMKTYTVAFDTTGGSAVSAETVNAGGTAYRPKSPTCNDKYKTFAYWTLDGTTEYDFNTVVNDSITLKAVWKDYRVGDRGPAGGYIFYDCDADNDSENDGAGPDGLKSSVCGWRFLEAAENDLNTTRMWGETSYDNWGTKYEIGTGKKNTEILCKKAGRNSFAHAVLEKEIDGYKDWFVPSRYELNLMYQNLYKNGIGNFRNDQYWSSSEAYAHYASYQDFSTGKMSEHSRDAYDYVRPVRSF